MASTLGSMGPGPQAQLPAMEPVPARVPTLQDHLVAWGVCENGAGGQRICLTQTQIVSPVGSVKQLSRVALRTDICKRLEHLAYRGPETEMAKSP